MLTSYAQNFEDVILWRALRHIENGFYVDVGAQDPVVESVSRAFYENGWRGIHAEATTYYASKVRENRPDEIVVQAAIGEGDGEIRFFEIPETGLSTSDHAIAMKHQAVGHRVVETGVPLMPLSALLNQAGPREIHWLKIDVEGMEASVIGSWAPSEARPWVVVVESTAPNSQEMTFETWEPTLVGKGYRFVYFDGLSRFYVSDKHPELVPSFGAGPNIFDAFVLAEQTPYTALVRSLYAGRISEEEAARKHEEAARKRLEASEEAILTQLHQLNLQLRHIEKSWSWRVTRPLRELKLRAVRTRAFPRKIVLSLTGRLIESLSKSQRLKNLALLILSYLPGVRVRLEIFAATRGYGGNSSLEQENDKGWQINAPKGATARWAKLLDQQNS
ncbi:FkbM family methyltransferase [Rhizobium cauense]|uniref:FkbM family methyltransferase n=1 Tax=Rhizobium cauense TaxID=1166683 RepID=UPI001C6EFFE6|nr:FkbM family methyltransferase [Rhizobium cauense]MBW9114861.1 FkbM family methyltransferase [Rhizobium cauense]